MAARFGFNDPIFRETDHQMMDAAFQDDHPRLKGHRPSALPLDQAIEMKTDAGEELILCKSVAPGTASGKIELFSQDLEDRFGYGLPRYEAVPQDFPLVVISPSSDKRTNATFGSAEACKGQEKIEINPADAAARNIPDGVTVRVWNNRGETHLTAVISEAVQPGVLYTPKGTWLRTSATGQTINALLDAAIRTDIEDGACCNEVFCEVEVANRL